jgi:hypothetical protein
MKTTPIPAPNQFEPNTLETITAEPRPPGEQLERMLHEIRGRASVAIKFIQSQPGRKDHTRKNHADLCGVETALAELQTALKNRKT